jgi:hypothetical protein
MIVDMMSRQLEVLQQQLTERDERLSQIEDARVGTSTRANNLAHTLECVYECIHAVLGLPEDVRRMVNVMNNCA